MISEWSTRPFCALFCSRDEVVLTHLTLLHPCHSQICCLLRRASFWSGQPQAQRHGEHPLVAG